MKISKLIFISSLILALLLSANSFNLNAQTTETAETTETLETVETTEEDFDTVIQQKVNEAKEYIRKANELHNAGEYDDRVQDHRWYIDRLAEVTKSEPPDHE